MKILIVEDEPTLLEFLERLFVSCQHDVRAFAFGAPAAEVIEPWQPDVLICDLGLPDVAGETLAAAAALLSPSAQVILMSGDKARLQRARPLATSVLFKPFHVQDVVKLVEAAG